MDRQKAGPLLVPKAGLRAVAVMHVPIDDKHAIQIQLVERLPCADGDVVEQAKSHRAARQGMMARRAHQAKGLAILARHDTLYRVAHGAGGNPRHVIGAGTARRVLFDPAAALAGKTLDLGDIFQSMHSGQLLERSWFPSRAGQMRLQAGFQHVPRNHADPRRTFRVLARFVLDHDRVVVEKCQSVCAAGVGIDFQVPCRNGAADGRKTPSSPRHAPGRAQLDKL